jgi:hypothetical protein
LNFILIFLSISGNIYKTVGFFGFFSFFLLNFLGFFVGMSAGVYFTVPRTVVLDDGLIYKDGRIITTSSVEKIFWMRKKQERLVRDYLLFF